MKDLWTVVRMEFMLTFRGRVIWVAGLVTAAFGIWSASMLRQRPWGAWDFIASPIFFMMLVLTFLTGDQIARDRDRHVDGVILSTPVSTRIYVWGKLLAGVGTLLLLAGIELLAAMIVDQLPPGNYPLAILSEEAYPPLGPAGYIVVWLLTAVPASLFGAALMLLGITSLRGQRVIAIVATFVIWSVPSILLTRNEALPLFYWIDISLLNFHQYQLDATNSILNLVFTAMTKRHLDPFNDPIPHDIGQQVMNIIRAELPPRSLPAVFWWNRAIFIAAAILLLTITVYVVQRQRRGLA